MLAEAEKRALFFAINFNHRYAKPLRLAREAIKAAKLGNITHAIWRFGGEANASPHPYANLIETQCHGFDQLEDLCGPIAGQDVLYSNGRRGVCRSMPRAEIGMQKMCEQFDAIHDARAGASEVGVCIHGEDSVVANRGDFAPTRLLQELSGELDRSLGLEAAWRNNQHFRRP